MRPLLPKPAPRLPAWPSASRWSSSADQDPRLQTVFPALARLDPDRQVIAMSDTGDIYQGDSAWITILWALRDYRRWAIRLARPAWRKHAKTAVHYLARNRRKIFDPARPERAVHLS